MINGRSFESCLPDLKNETLQIIAFEGFFCAKRVFGLTRDKVSINLIFTKLKPLIEKRRTQQAGNRQLKLLPIWLMQRA
jgi:hypothetical protein